MDWGLRLEEANLLIEGNLGEKTDLEMDFFLPIRCLNQFSGTVD